MSAIGSSPGRPVVGLIVTIVVVATVLAVQQIRAGYPMSCAWVSPRDISEGPAFAPSEGLVRHSNPRAEFFSLGGRPVEAHDADVIGPRLGGHRLRWVVSGPKWGLTLFFLDRAVLPTDTTDTALAAGGLIFTRTARGDGKSWAEQFRRQFPGRVRAFDIGQWVGSLSWGDALPNGIKPHSVLWADDDRDYSLVGDVSTVHIVNLARSVACTFRPA